MATNKELSNAGDPLELLSILGTIKAAEKENDEDTYIDLLFNDLRECLVNVDQIHQFTPLALNYLTQISDSPRFVEAYLDAFIYFYNYSARNRTGIMTMPAMYGYKNNSNQSYFGFFLNILRKKIDRCSTVSSMYYSVLFAPPQKAIKLLLNYLSKAVEDSIFQKNAAICICYMMWRDPISTKKLFDNFEKSIIDENYRLLLRFFLTSGYSDEIPPLPDEDLDLKWMQSFLSPMRPMAKLLFHPSEINIESALNDVLRLQTIANNRDFEMEFDAYKCLNEDLASIFTRRFNIVSEKMYSRLFSFYLEACNFKNLQSHELLRKGIVLSSSQKDDPNSSNVYGYTVNLN